MKGMYGIKVDTRKFNRHLTDIARRQIPFASAKTLTMTAKDAQKSLQVEIAAVMTLRTPEVNKGVIVTPARKADGIHRMQSIVGHRSWYMAQQMGKRIVTRKPRSGKYEYIPRGVRKTKTGKISRNYKIKNVFKLKGTYITKPKNGRAAIFKRVNGRPVLLYSAIKKQTITPKMDMFETSGRVAKKQMPRNFIKAMRSAMRTAR